MSNNLWRSEISIDGAARLIVVVNSKLNEMTGREDSTLADYVVILVQGGKTEGEIKKDLQTFLGDWSGPFVSWLFQHLATNIHHYKSPQRETQFAEQRNISSEMRSINEQSESSLNAKSLGESLAGSAKHTERNPNYNDGEEEDSITGIARKNIFERPAKFNESNKNGEVTNRNNDAEYEDNSAGISGKSIFGRPVKFHGCNKNGELANRNNDAEDDDNTDSSRKNIFESLGNVREWNKDVDGELANRNRKRSRLSHDGNDKTFSNTHFPTPKRLKMEYKGELPVPPVVSACPTKPLRTPRNTVNKAKRTSVFDRLGPTRSTVNNEKRTSVFDRLGPTRNTINNEKRISVFDMLGEKIDPTTKRINSVPANEGTHTSQNLVAKSVVVSNVHYGATSQALTKHFMPCGEVNQVHLLKDISTGFPNGSAVVWFSSEEGANRALSLDGSTFMDRKLLVNPKFPPHTTTTTGREHINPSPSFQWKRDA